MQAHQFGAQLRVIGVRYSDLRSKPGPEPSASTAPRLRLRLWDISARLGPPLDPASLALKLLTSGCYRRWGSGCPIACSASSSPSSSSSRGSGQTSSAQGRASASETSPVSNRYAHRCWSHLASCADQSETIILRLP